MGRRRDDQISSADVQRLAYAGARWFRGLSSRGQLAVVVVLIVGALVTLFWYQQQQARLPTAVATGSPHMLLGNPSDAGRDPDNLLLVEPYFALAYDDAAGEAKWVSWRLTAADLGTARRRDDFTPDPNLPAACRPVYSSAYDRSGFDRGHLCPHGDRMSDLTASYATFVTTNIVPQAPGLNQKAWAQCEEYCRGLARHGHRLYVTAGPAGLGGRGRSGRRETVGNGRVAVPADCWKVIVITDDDAGVDPDPATFTASTRVLTVDMPNDQSVGEAWAQYRTTPAEVERRTGLHLFDRVRPDVAAAWRMRVDRTPLPPPTPARWSDD